MQLDRVLGEVSLIYESPTLRWGGGLEGGEGGELLTPSCNIGDNAVKQLSKDLSKGISRLFRVGEATGHLGVVWQSCFSFRPAPPGNTSNRAALPIFVLCMNTVCTVPYRILPTLSQPGSSSGVVHAGCCACDSAVQNLPTPLQSSLDGTLFVRRSIESDMSYASQQSR